MALATQGDNSSSHNNLKNVCMLLHVAHVTPCSLRLTCMDLALQAHGLVATVVD